MSVVDVRQDLLVLADSRSSQARKLSLAVLGVILTHAGECQELLGPVFAALLRFSRLDGDATVRCGAFDCIAEYLGEILPRTLSFVEKPGGGANGCARMRRSGWSR